MRQVLHVSNCTHRWLLGTLSNQGDTIEQLHVKTRYHTNPIVKLVATRALNLTEFN